jgi:hypothetical protein
MLGTSNLRVAERDLSIADDHDVICLFRPHGLAGALFRISK